MNIITKILKDKISMSAKLKPFIWLDTPIDQVFDFYKSIFKTANIKNSNSFSGTIEIFGQNLLFMNGGPHYKLNPSFSLMIDCENQEEVDYYWNALTQNGGQEGQCGWCIDKFGLSWQVTPNALPQALFSFDQETANYARDAMMKMKKIIISELFRP